MDAIKPKLIEMSQALKTRGLSKEAAAACSRPSLARSPAARTCSTSGQRRLSGPGPTAPRIRCSPHGRRPAPSLASEDA